MGKLLQGESDGLLGEIIRQLWLVVSLLFIAVGISGLMAIAFGNLWGKSFISGDGPGVTYASWRCAEYQQLAPEARDCASAAVAHHYWEETTNRIGAGVIGLVGLIIWRLFIRKIKAGRLPNIVWLASALAITGMLSILGTGLGAMRLLFGVSDGAGSMLSVGLTFGLISLYLMIKFWKQSQAFKRKNK